MYTELDKRYFAIREAFHYDHLKSAALPEAASFRESAQKWTTIFRTQCDWLLEPLRDIVACYSAEMDHSVFTKHILLQMMEFSIRMTPTGSFNIPHAWQLRMMINLRQAGYTRIGFHKPTWGEFDIWHLGKPPEFCFRPDCEIGCHCSEPLTTEYLESHFRNGDYLFY